MNRSRRQARARTHAPEEVLRLRELLVELGRQLLGPGVGALPAVAEKELPAVLLVVRLLRERRLVALGRLGRLPRRLFGGGKAGQTGFNFNFLPNASATSMYISRRPMAMAPGPP